MSISPLRGLYDTPLYRALVQGPIVFQQYRNNHLDYDPDGRPRFSTIAPYYSPLIVACMKSDPISALILIEDGANPNIVDPEGMTAFLWSIQNGLHDVFCKLLLDRSVDIKRKTKSEWGALHFAVFYNRYEIVEGLRGLGAQSFDPDESALDGSTPRDLVKNKKMSNLLK